MAERLSGHEVSDLCLGKPSLRSLSLSDTLADALSALKKFAADSSSFLSVWNCHHSVTRPHLTRHSHNKQQKDKNKKKDEEEENCRCVGKICMVDIICFLCKPHNLSSPSSALQSPISVLLPHYSTSLVRHLNPNARLVEAIDCMYEGVQNLVIAIEKQSVLECNLDSNIILHNKKRCYCWLTQEDVIRYLVNSISVFSPTPGNPINTLGVIDTQNLFVLHYDDPASSALDLLSLSLVHGSSVAIVDSEGKFVGEISPFMLNSCDESVVPAIATLSAGNLMAYIDCGGPPEDLLHLVKESLQEQNLTAAMELLNDETGLSSWSSFSSSSSDEEFCSGGKNWKLGGYSARVMRRSEAIVCYPWSSLVAVMIQALAHRVSYVWVVEEDGTLTGIVTFEGMFKIFREHLKCMC